MDFSEFIFDFKSIKTIKKGGVYLSCGTRAYTRWHARPRGRAVQTHASACVARR